MPVIDDPRGLINALRAFADLKERKGDPEYQTELVRNAAKCIEELLAPPDDDASVTIEAPSKRELFVVAVGNAFEGMAVYGPFDDHQRAENFADDCTNDTFVIGLEEPE